MPKLFDKEDSLQFDECLLRDTSMLTKTNNFKMANGGAKVSHDTGSIEDRTVSQNQKSIPRMRTYAQKMNIAEALITFALLSQNTKQLRRVLETAASHPYYYFNVISLSLSIIIQILIGIGLILSTHYQSNTTNLNKAYQLQRSILLCIMFSTVLNMFIASFTVNIPVASYVNSS